MLALQQFEFAIEVIPGKEKLVADSLSKIDWPLTLPNPDASNDFVEMLYADSDSPEKLGARYPLLS